MKRNGDCYLGYLSWIVEVGVGRRRVPVPVGGVVEGVSVPWVMWMGMENLPAVRVASMVGFGLVILMRRPSRAPTTAASQVTSGPEGSSTWSRPEPGWGPEDLGLMAGLGLALAAGLARAAGL